MINRFMIAKQLSSIDENLVYQAEGFLTNCHDWFSVLFLKFKGALVLAPFFISLSSLINKQY